ncbi:uncharacterized protein LOC107040490 isoform X2 [Diachasma alloeum]|uniref:uncharacterized protein LOC107040490 isoform X2 n=1 Tax=Diachasma alloeum TaxID=454923 RepID=UPI0007384A14|nr:uncharacterized protein LOC107040490 isoform X2 [Diachasma alloeum]
MKRLLEWKQRMLQSPLTRKPTGTTNGVTTAQSELSSYYKRQALLDLAAHEASVAEARHSRRRDDNSHRPHTRSKSSDGRRSVANVSRYNSYSSDDEASGSGSVIGRDPLPPRAVSTSQLSQTTLTQPPSLVSTLPLARANGRQQITGVLPVHQSTPQPTSARLPATGGNDSDSSICRDTSIADVRSSSSMVNNEASRISPSDTTQRLVSPARNFRVVSPIDHRVSSPSDSERHIHSPCERLMTSPVSIREMNGDMAVHHQIPRVVQGRESTTELLQKRARPVELDQPRRLENLQKLDELKKHLMDLEKQYEKGKPLVNLVDNMVKLGTLYNRNGVNGSVAGSRQELMQMQDVTREQRERLEFNQRVQEQKILVEERRDWARLSPDHGQLQAKVQQLYKLDRLLQEESGKLHSLQQDKELLEKALGGLKYKLQGSRSNPAEVEKYKKQQILLERELARVRMLLVHNSKKLEETVAENARLEQDLVVLRQKLQASRRYAGSMRRDTSGTTVAVETELRRVQQLVGDLQRQRQELSVQVRQLTEKSHSLVQQIRPNQQQAVSPAPQVYHPKKKAQSSWLETDLDSGMTLDHGLDSPSSSTSSMSPRNRQNGSPHQHIPSPQYKDPPAARYSPTSVNRPAQPINLIQPGRSQSYHCDAQQNHITAISPQLREQIQQHQLKQQLLKDQMQGKGSPIQSIVPLYVNTDSRRINSSDGMKRMDSGVNGVAILPPEYVPPPRPPPCEEALLVNGGYGHDDNNFAGLIPNREKQEIKTVRIVKRESERRQRDRGDRNSNIGIPLTNGLQAPGGAKRLGEDDFGSVQFEKAQLGRVVEESALIHAQSTVQLSELDDVQFQRSMSLPRGFGGQRPQPGVHNGPVPPPPRSDSMNALRNMMARRHRVRGMGRARDDLDMERALRPRINAPDVVRSTLSHKELKYNESTIDQLLGTPNKIFIPERYIPEQTPELSAEEKKQRLKKADAIRKMLSETTVTTPEGDDENVDIEKSNTLKKKVAEEKRQRDHILQLNQILAKQVMEKSKMVAGMRLKD